MIDSSSKGNPMRSSAFFLNSFGKYFLKNMKGGAKRQFFLGGEGGTIALNSAQIDFLIFCSSQNPAFETQNLACAGLSTVFFGKCAQSPSTVLGPYESHRNSKPPPVELLTMNGA